MPLMFAPVAPIRKVKIYRVISESMWAKVFKKIASRISNISN